jgi:hypothetical protein
MLFDPNVKTERRDLFEREGVRGFVAVSSFIVRG